MSTSVKQFHEEEQIGKTYDFQVARRLLRYLKPYLKLLFPALVLTHPDFLLAVNVGFGDVRLAFDLMIPEFYRHLWVTMVEVVTASGLS
jgi:hypothetical protein